MPELSGRRRRSLLRAIGAAWRAGVAQARPLLPVDELGRARPSSWPSTKET